MLWIPRPAHHPLSAASPLLPCGRARPGLASHPLLSQDSISMADSDLGVTLDSLTLCPLLPFALFSLFPSPTAFADKHHSDASTSPQLCRLYPTPQGRTAPFSDFLWPSCFLSHPPHTCLGNPTKHKPDHITWQLKTLQCLFTAVKKKTKNERWVLRSYGSSSAFPPLSLPQVLLPRLSLSPLSLAGTLLPRGSFPLLSFFGGLLFPTRAPLSIVQILT